MGRTALGCIFFFDFLTVSVLKKGNNKSLKMFWRYLKNFCYNALFLVATQKSVFATAEVQISPNIMLPTTYNVQILPNFPVHVNVSIILYEIISVDEPRQVAM